MSSPANHHLFVIAIVSPVVSAAPVPSSAHDLDKYLHFPYPISGPTPSPLHAPGRVLDMCSQSNSYAISFDDGPGQLTDELLDYLDEQKVKVTFFVNGKKWSPESQRLLRRAFNAQHQIAAHPWSHRDLESLSDSDIRLEMTKIEDAFRSILGVVPRYMRPPYGEHSRRVRDVLEEMGYVLVLWDVDLLHDPHHDADSHDSNLGGHVVVEQVDRGQEEDDDEDVYDFDGQFPMVAPPSIPTRSASNSAVVTATADEFTSKWAEAVRGVAHRALSRESMVLGGIYQEATSIWAVEYVQSLNYDIMTIGACVGETDPRLWYKEIGAPAPVESIPQTCHA
ncbi:hypothetical protein BGW38_003612 [Lunasporangiospora selenospora]|uniref:NodB homology domain-containing protein n=1 Tax=Lunasporangiospora selenospora TaxID=979761 RepID=A0A9P6KC28_9FUNG|nr:hypothetical protein BGW38_003612 [Lunasporangiospora selenospora]